MAIKGQCETCCAFRLSNGYCSAIGQIPVIDDLFCEKYKQKKVSLYNEPNMSDVEKDQLSKSKTVRKSGVKRVVVIILVLVFIIAVAVLGLYIKQEMSYKRVVEGKTLNLCDEYLDDYPDGRYIDEVLELKDSLAFELVLSEKMAGTCNWYLDVFPEGKYVEEVLYRKIRYSENQISVINEYLNSFPKGVYVDSVNILYDLLWDAEIEKYNNRDKGKESAKAVKYMMGMLQYMKTHRVNTIHISVNPTLKLKDYTEYNKEVIELLEILYSDERLPLKNSNVVSLKSNFRQGDLDQLKSVLSRGVQQSMDNMFTPGFIEVTSGYDGDTINCPQLTFNYTIKSQEDYGIPHIWVYTESLYHGGQDIPKYYLIGISINFNAEFTIPNSDVNYSYSEKGLPENNISGINDIEDGYRKMTRMCFEQFSDKMAKNMGLDETYSE